MKVRLNGESDGSGTEGKETLLEIAREQTFGAGLPVVALGVCS
jgi:hypothetical protein